MKKRLYHIICRALGFLLVAMGMSITVSAQKPVQHIVIDQTDTVEFSVDQWPGDRYTWDLYTDSTGNFATNKGDLGPVPYFVDDMYEGSTVRVTGLEPGRYFLRVMVWDDKTCTNNLSVFLLDVLARRPDAVLYADSVCIGEPLVFKVVFTGTGPWEMIYTYGDGTTHLNLTGNDYEVEFTPAIPPLPVGPMEFWILEVSDQVNVSNKTFERVKAIIYPKPKGSRIYQVDK